MTLKQQEQIRQMRSDGEGYKRIASLLGISVNTVKSFCRRDTKAADEMEHGMSEASEAPTCARCHKPITQIPGRRKRRFCSDACRVSYWRVQAEPRRMPCKCAGCGRALRGNDRHRKYCSHACYITHRFHNANTRGGQHEQIA